MQFLKNGILLIIFYGVASCKPHKMNYLDMEWVNHAKNRVVNAKTAKKLLNAGIKQFSSKNYKKAKISFE
ncbi:MAG: hypothetical protein D6767_10995 [Candidatus Hydrogenedentota bacterium]|nr:MAG: hypothetical protein D6767_10995 [Candidatus Hydrogenedentota bacterium]